MTGPSTFPSRGVRIALALLFPTGLAAQDPPTPDELIRQLVDGEGRELAVEGLVRSGALGAEAVRALLVRDKPLDRDVVVAACRVLESIGPPAAPCLSGVVERFYRNDAKGVRPRLLTALRRLGAFDHEVRDTWHKALKQLDDGATSVLSLDGFFEAVGAMQVDGKQAGIKDLVEALKDPNALLWIGVGNVVGHRAGEWSPEQKRTLAAAISAKLEEEMPTSFKMSWLWGDGEASTSGGLSSEQKVIRRRLQWALARLDPANPAAVRGHVEDFDHGNPLVAVQAMRMVMMQPDGADDEVIRALARVLDEGGVTAAREAATVLGVAGAGSPVAIRALENAVANSTDGQLVKRAEAALRALGK